jgi:hypothetical protein
MARSRLVEKIVVAGLLGSMTNAFPAVALDTDSRTQFRISGTVRTICRVQFDSATAVIEGDSVDFGRMTEFCNNAEGYTIVINTPQQLDGATLYVDGIAKPLSESGTTVVVDSSVPNWQRRSITLDLQGKDPATANVSFRAQAKGFVY